jgi:predicted MFS family arabinose efflux permease
MVQAPPAEEPDASGTAISRGLVLLMATACALSVANLYYAQPILDTLAHAFHTGSASAGLVVTASQLGYALGLALVVPLGDLLVRRRLVPVVLLLTTAALAVSALAPSLAVLAVGAVGAGTGSVVAQVLVPLAASLADEHRRGQVVGTVMSGLLLGILLARTLSGIVAGAASWRAVYAVAAALSVLMAGVLAARLPGEPARRRVAYAALLASELRLLLTERVLQRRALFGALGFATFSVFWTTMAFLLAGPPYRYGDVTIGLFGLVGAGGALCASFAGRWADRGLTTVTTFAFALATAASFVALWFGGRSLALLVVGILVLDVGVQGLQVTNQSLIYRLAPELRSRLNSAYMVCYFTGGAVGSAVGSAVYAAHRWAGVCILGSAIAFLVVLLAAADLRRAEDSGHRRSAASGT